MPKHKYHKRKPLDCGNTQCGLCRRQPKEMKHYEKYPEKFEHREEYGWAKFEAQETSREDDWEKLYEAEFRWFEEGRLEDLDVHERRRIARAGSGLATPMERGMGNMSFSSLFHFRAVK